MDKKIMVEREKFISHDKEYFGYFIKGKVRGKDVRDFPQTPEGSPAASPPYPP